jgi:hypothetical protein
LLIGHTSVPKLLTVNILGKDRKTFKSVKIGTDSAEYSISSNTCTGSQRGPSQCSIYVTFTPNHSGTRSDAEPERYFGQPGHQSDRDR